MWLTVEDTVSGHSDSFSQQADRSREAGTTPSGQTVTKDSCTAFVSNLDYAITAEQIHDIFCKVRTLAHYNIASFHLAVMFTGLTYHQGISVTSPTSMS